MLRAIIAEKDDFLREKIAGILSRNPMINIVAQIVECNHIHDRIILFDPNLIFVDFGLTGDKCNSFQEIKNGCSNLKIIVLVENIDTQANFAASLDGVDAVIEKSRLLTELPNLIKGVFDESAAC